MAYEPIVYHGVTSKAFCEMKDALQAQGFSISEGEEGGISGKDFAGAYQWCEKEQRLTIRIQAKPWFLPYKFIVEKINDTIGSLIAK
ncbi:MAG: hypothetical protein MJB12_03545 [Firmicutes bacterium]|nr:hypothetical protein [Bacillota bacterium]